MADKIVSQEYGGAGSFAPQVETNQTDIAALLEELKTRSNPNMFINPDFKVNTELDYGTSIQSTGTRKYVADVWGFQAGNNCKMTTYASVLSNSPDWDNSGLNYGGYLRLRVDDITGGSNSLYPSLIQFGAHPLPDGDFTASLKVWGITAGKVRVRVVYGNRDTVNDVWVEAFSEWKEIPEATGDTLVTLTGNLSYSSYGANMRDIEYSYIRFDFDFDAPTVNDRIYLGEPKLELGSYATPCIMKTYAEDLLDVQAQYYRIDNNITTPYTLRKQGTKSYSSWQAIFGTGFINSGDVVLSYVEFPTTMDNTPTFSASPWGTSGTPNYDIEPYDRAVSGNLTTERMTTKSCLVGAPSAGINSKIVTAYASTTGQKGIPTLIFTRNVKLFVAFDARR